MRANQADKAGEAVATTEASCAGAVRSRPAILSNSVIVAAHPDDELLWFGSILKDVDQVILAFSDFWGNPDLGAQRRAAIAEHPHPNILCLEIPEAGSYGCANWKRPRPSEFGLSFPIFAGLNGIKRGIKRGLGALKRGSGPVPHLSATAHYGRNYSRIRMVLRDRLTADMNVFTHTPWGEYGHEDHVQVFRAVESLRQEIGFTLWISNYCTERALPLAARYFRSAPTDSVRLETDKAYCEQVADVYRRHGCWTWADDWAWFGDESFMHAPAMQQGSSPHRHLASLNMFTIGR